MLAAGIRVPFERVPNRTFYGYPNGLLLFISSFAKNAKKRKTEKDSSRLAAIIVQCILNEINEEQIGRRSNPRLSFILKDLTSSGKKNSNFYFHFNYFSHQYISLKLFYTWIIMYTARRVPLKSHSAFRLTEYR